MFTTPVEDVSFLAPSHLPIEWKTFTNTRFGYSVEYPSLVQIMSQTDGLDPQIDSGVDFFIPGKSRFTVSVLSQSIIVNAEARDKQKLPADRMDFTEVKKLLALNLKTYAQTIYQYQVNDPNPYAKDKQVGSLEETIIDGQKAYQFTLTDSFAFDATGKNGYTIGDKPNMYVITESPLGDKFVIHYLVGDSVSEKIFQSFKFVR